MFLLKNWWGHNQDRRGLLHLGRYWNIGLVANSAVHDLICISLASVHVAGERIGCQWIQGGEQTNWKGKILKHKPFSCNRNQLLVAAKSTTEQLAGNCLKAQSYGKSLRGSGSKLKSSQWKLGNDWSEYLLHWLVIACLCLCTTLCTLSSECGGF